jgi:putative transposase
VYLKGYATMDDLTIGLTQYFTFYNGERTHQSLAYKTPIQVYANGRDGGAIIVDKFGGAVPLHVKKGCSLNSAKKLS